MRTRPAAPARSAASLTTFIRPRFFPGQLLTDRELVLLEQYAIDKHRLHNLHLHGWGVVCGLQVLCDDCGDGVLVRSGYTIDPCGNDIIVPVDTKVDVLDLIEQCRNQSRPEPCDPPRWPQATGCDDDETWCLTVRYKEHHTRSVTPLGGRATAGTCGCGGTGTSGCGCGGSTSGGSKNQGAGGRAGWECTCGAPRNTGTCTCDTPPGDPIRPADCQPSRTHELYEFGVCRSDGSCRDLGARLEGTFPARVVECITALRPIFSSSLNKEMQATAARLVLGGEQSDVDVQPAVCALYEAVVKVYMTDPLRTVCVLPPELTLLDCSPRTDNETVEHYNNRMRDVVQALLLLVLAYLRDCICHHLMPPCTPDACDDRVTLACLTVRDGKVVEICNFDCRRYAGSFVSREYWLPIGPVLSWLAALVCCFPILERRAGRLVGADFGSVLRSDSTKHIRAALIRNNFSSVRAMRTRVGQFAGEMRPKRLIARLEERAAKTDGQVDLGAYVNMKESDALTGLASADVVVSTLPIEEAERPVFSGIGLFPTVPKGTPVVAYVSNGRVVGFSIDRGTS